jgi:thiol-disulfide isomerase/thioredoxin
MTTRSRPRRTLNPAAVAFSALVLLAISAPSHAGEIVFRPDYEFSVEVNGIFPKDATFFTSDVRGKYFINVPSTRDGLLMDLLAKKIFAVPRNLIDEGERALTIRDGIPAGTRAYAFAIDGPTIRFETDVMKVRIVRALMRPPLTGVIQVDDLLADRPEYRAGVERYAPDETAMKTLAAYGKEVVIEAYFGTWCGHCQMFMPKVLRVLLDAANPMIKVDLVGVPKNFGRIKGPWDGKGITAIPTVIVKKDGREITRLSIHEGSLPEVELAGILRALK